MDQQELNVDIVIVGGGLVGMSLAVGLAKSPCSVLLLEQNQAAPLHDNVLDLRTTGLTRSSEKMFEQMGIWKKMATAATAIERLDISEQGNFGGARIDAVEHGISPIGYMMPNYHLMKVLSDEVASLSNLTVLSPASCQAIDPVDNGCRYRVTIKHDDQKKYVTASLLVGADGANSKVRELLNITATHKKYHQSAIITNVQTQKSHENVAYERFTQHGPLAVLPIKNDHCALIWTQAENQVEHYLQMNDEDFLSALQKAFGYRLGKFLAVGQRAAYPLSMTSSDQLTQNNAVLVGNAAQTIHPVAAQGFNLGLRDVHTLVHLLNKNQFKPELFASLLEEYQQLRVPDRQHVIRLTDGLTRLFAPQIWPAKLLRGIGVRMIGGSSLAQRSVLRRNTSMRYLLGFEGEPNG